MMKELMTTQFISHSLYNSGLPTFLTEEWQITVDLSLKVFEAMYVRFKNSVLWNSHNPNNKSKSTTYSMFE